MPRLVRFVVPFVVISLAGCGGRLAADADPGHGSFGPEAGVSTTAVSPVPACDLGKRTAPSAPACGAEVSTCDPLHPQGLPVGACSAGETCSVTARFACACPDEPGPRFPWRCACDAGAWRCELDPPDARACSNTCLAGADAGGGGDAPTCPKPKAISPPGPRVTNASTAGTGACSGETLGSVIAAARSAAPSLAGIDTIYDPATTWSDGSFIHAFATADGFALAFKRGRGDCPAGCTDNEWWYFETDASCVPKQVGHYHPAFAGSCLAVDGAAMWGTPPPSDPVSICGAELAAENISGTYALCATGSHTACTDKAGAEPTVKFTTSYLLVVAQDPADLSKGTVTVTGTGNPKVDGVPFDAKFTRRRFEATKSYSNLPARCGDEWQLSMALDFEGVAVPGRLSFFESRSIGCSATSGGGSYCKGQIYADLFAP